MAAPPGPNDLTALAKDKIISSLGKLASSIACRFSCGNTLSSPEKVKLIYQGNSGDFSSITFPGTEHTAIQQLLSACSVASSGVVGEEVTNLSYRNALKLQPDRFTTDFQLCNTPIMDEIRKLMMPDVHGSIRAELYQLNIYAGPGGHFKAHVDTPRSSQMFGSLVVCLPTQFSGGALVTRHQGKEVRFDWSSSPQNPMQKVSWAAFFSDVEHEVLPVTDGYCLTLTYNLYSVDKLQDLPPTANIPNSSFYHELRAAVSNPHFLRDGGVLGFRCQHDYVFLDLNSTDSLQCLLKGADNIVYTSATSLGLPVVVKPVTMGRFYHAYRHVLPYFKKFSALCDADYDEDCNEDPDDLIEHIYHNLVHNDKRIIWCQKTAKFQPAIAYGNDASCEVVYQAATILVCVPKWGMRQALEVEPHQCACEQATEPRRDIGQQSSNQEGNGSDEGEKPPAEKRRREEARAAAFGGPEMDELLCFNN